MAQQLNIFNKSSDVSANTEVLDHSVNSIINYGQAAEGTTLSPNQSGDYRVPAPQNFRIVESTYASLGNVFVLAWTDIEVPGVEVARYEIYASNFLNTNAEPTLVGSASKSPCYTRVTATEASSVTFKIRPVLINGLSLPLDSCPACTGTAAAPIYEFTAIESGSGDSVTVSIKDDIETSPGNIGPVGLTVVNSDTDQYASLHPGGFYLGVTGNDEFIEILINSITIYDTNGDANLALSYIGSYGGILTVSDPATAESVSIAPHNYASAGALEGYFEVYIDGAQKKVPYYAVS